MEKSETGTSTSCEDILTSIRGLKGGERCALRGLNSNSSLAYLLSRSLNRDGRTILLVAPTEESAEALTGDLAFFLDGGGGDGVVTYIPSTEVLPFELQPIHPDILSSRSEALSDLASGNTFITVISLKNLLHRVPPRSLFQGSAFEVLRGGDYPIDALMERFVSLGYVRVPMVEERGEVSVRGGIIDIFPPRYDTPARIEFFGDEVESIRNFDIATQRSIRNLKSLEVLPPKEISLTSDLLDEVRDRLLERADTLSLDRERWDHLLRRFRDGNVHGMDTLLPLFYPKLETVFDYLDGETVIVMADPDGMEGEEESFRKLLDERLETVRGEGEFYLELEELYLTGEELRERLSGFPIVDSLIRESIYSEVLLTAGGPFSGDEARRYSSTETLRVESNSDLAYNRKKRGGASPIPVGEIELTPGGRLLSTDLLDGTAEEGQLKEGVEERSPGEEGERPLQPLVRRIKTFQGHGFRVFITAHNSGAAERTRELLESYGLIFTVSEGGGLGEEGGPLVILRGELTEGFRIPADGVVYISEEEVFGERVKRRQSTRRRLESFLTELQDLSPGSPIVHAIHGIGIYRGLERIETSGVSNDFLLLEYKDGDKLYLPAQKMDLISRYHSVDTTGVGEVGAEMPDLSKLGGPGWEKKKKRVRKGVEKLAGELMKLYMERGSVKGFTYSPPCRIFEEFEDSFEFTETPDQGRAIEEVMGDMSRDTPMDRLVCGDVGYGKTEVAMRAAFRAVLDGRQVAVMVPTTILAQQHYKTFCERFAPYPARIDMVSRFRSTAEQRATLEAASEGGVDILIGTHRLLQKDVSFKELGLIIVDEEHRFGVTHKERLKSLKRSVDVLTLTATPIPRTLQMSVASIRDLSIITTPPEDRLSVKTSVIPFDEGLIKEAIMRELDRGGQVFFVHNRIQSLGGIEEVLRRIVPEARIAVAHGQMKEHELEERMAGFIGRDYDILLSTAIIESGLDIPGANTIIINRGDRFGLSELHQLRGRVGRSSRRAYAYIVSLPPQKLTPDAKRRMEVIQELSDPGAGFRIAAYDLEIRGAGELLGTNQSGHIMEVGFDLYVELLEEAVAEAKGEVKGDELPPPEVNLKVSQFIPDDYVPDLRQRLGLYKRIASVEDTPSLLDIWEELRDRYGPLPEEVRNLLTASEIKVLLKALGGEEFTESKGKLYIRFNGEVMTERLKERLLLLVAEGGDQYRLTPEGRLVVRIPLDFDLPAGLDRGEGEPPESRYGRFILKDLGKG